MRQKTYYDPIYNQIVIPQRLSASSANLSRQILKENYQSSPVDRAIVKVLGTESFDRLSFLYQSGVAWLVFPSATHTRFAHSLGCFHLGKIALRSVTVIQEESQQGENQWFLGDWLKTVRSGDFMDPNNYYFECVFLASLLCHDLGHFPFSHTIEMNHHLDLRYTHEEKLFRSLDKSFFRHFSAIACPYEFSQNVLKDQKHFKAALKYLICGTVPKPNVLPRKDTDDYRARLGILKKLVSGLLDLDRVDHYLRDSFFTGVRLANFNIEYLLRGITFRVSRDSRNTTQILGRDALIHAKNLLYSKDQINDAIFENPDFIGYELSLNSAVTTYLMRKSEKVEEKEVEEILGLQDWQLLNKLASFGKGSSESSKKLHKMVGRIFQKRPLKLVGKFALKGNLHVDFAVDGDIQFNYHDDKEMLAALGSLYDYIFYPLRVLDGDSGKLSTDSSLQQVVTGIFETSKKNLCKIMRKNSDAKEAILHFITYVLFHATQGAQQPTIKGVEEREFIYRKQRILSEIGKTAYRKLNNAIKRELASKLREEFKQQFECEFYFKFSKLFLDLHSLSMDVKDLSEIKLADSGLTIAEDLNEKEFLRMFASRDFKSRVNLWIYSEDSLSAVIKRQVIDVLDRRGFRLVQESY